MEKYTRTTIDQLRIGDRFYRLGDKRKQEWTKVIHKSNRFQLQSHTNWALKDACRYPLAMDTTTEVIFLRHVSITKEFDTITKIIQEA